MKLKHHQQIVDMLYSEWDLGKTRSGAKGKVCAWIYWFEILSEAERIIIEKDSNNIIGVCGYTKWNSKKYFARKRFYKALTQLLMYSPLVKNTKSLLQYGKDYDYLPKELEGYFDGEITIIIVNKKYRNQKIGKKLIQQIFALAKQDDVKRLQILTDQSCDYKFYEKLGCKKKYETLVPNGEPGKCGDRLEETGYIYEKDLTK